jgi:nitroreductase
MDDSSTQSVADIIRGRRTINFFKPEVPPRETLLEGIEAARWAPNHHLTEPWRFYLLSDPVKQQIVDLNARMVARERGEDAGREKHERWSRIPGWLVLTCVRSSDELRQKEDYAACCCAAQNLALYLWSRGIGMKWTTGAVTRSEEFYDLIWVDPVVEQVVGLFWYGYPDEVPVSVRKAVPEIVVEL